MNRIASRPDIDEHELIRSLEVSPELDLGTDGHLVRLPTDNWRDDRLRFVHFHWVCREGIRYNLTAGTEVARVFEDTRAFFQAYPDLGIRPLALLQQHGLDVAVLEHFEGQSLESALAAQTVTPDAAVTLLDRLADQLDAAARPADPDEVSAAIDLLHDELLEHPVWGTLDRCYFDSIVFPYLRETFSEIPLKHRWTNGDFVARNVMLGATGEVRLIDFEFAADTPFALADYFRFGEFSGVPAALCDHIRARLPGDARAWRIHYCLDQACKLARIRSPEAFAFDAEDLMLHLLEGMREVMQGLTQHPTCLFRSRADYDALTRHAASLQKRYDEMASHDRAIQSQYDALVSHTGTLQSQYDALASHNGALQSQYDALDAHTQSLQAHYERLEAHAQNVQAAADAHASRACAAEASRDDLARRLYRLRRPWLWIKKRVVDQESNC